jgi:NarL family two-component system response regulator LiaR
MSGLCRALRLAIVNDYDVVVAGIVTMLAGYRDRVEIIELDTRMPVLRDVDIVLFDTFALTSRGMAMSDLVRPGGPKVVVFTWSADPHAIATFVDQGAAGYLSKALPSADLVKALEDIHAGALITTPSDETALGHGSGDWPGRESGLSPREAEVLALIAHGLTNEEIAKTIYLSINSVKTYIRMAYRKIGVRSRSQAVLWALQNGFTAEPSRTGHSES